MPVAALILGILSVIFSISVVLFFAGIPVGLLAVVLGVIARKRAIAGERPAGAATAGLALGVVGVVLGLVLYAACSFVNKRANAEFDKLAHDQNLHQQNQEFEQTLNKMLAPLPRDGGQK